MRRISFEISVGIAVVCFAGGCGSNVDRPAKLIEGGAYKNAAEAVLGDREGAVTVAASLLGLAAARPEYMYRAVDRLSATGEAGRRVLTSIAERTDALGRAARLGLARFDTPDDWTERSCAADTESEVRRLCALFFHRSLSAETLRRMMTDIDATVRFYALKGAALLPSDVAKNMGAAEVLRRDPSRKVRLEAARRGDLLGDDALLLLKAATQSELDGMRLAAVEGLSTLGTSDALALLASMAAGPMDNVSLAASAALSAGGDMSARERLLGALKDKRPGVRASALYLLDAAKIPDRADRVAAALDDVSPETVLAAANLMRRDETRRAEILKALLRVSEKTEGAQAASILALRAQLSDSEAADALRAALEETGADEAATIQWIGRATGAVLLFDDISRLMGDDREKVRIEAAFAILFSRPKI